jgi:hypothetical protein
MAYQQMPGPDGDPGYIESLRTGTRLAELRKFGLILAVVPVVVFVGIPMLVHDGKTPAWTLVLPLLAAVGAYIAARQLAASVQALPAEGDPHAVRERALAALRRSMLVRLGVTAVPLVLGLLASLIGGSLLPYAVGFLLGWPQMLRALPDARMIEESRARLEAHGVYSGLWEALVEPTAAASHRRG